MKYNFSILLTVLLFLNGPFLLAQTTVSKLNLVGNVRSVKETSFEAILENGKISKGEKQREITGDFDFEVYFQKPNIKALEHIYIPKKGVYFKRTFKYNEDGFLIEKDWFQKDERELYNWKYTLDKQGNPTTVTYTSEKGIIHQKKENNYNEKNEKTESKSFKSDGSLVFKETFRFDAKGNLIENIKFDAKLRPKIKLTYTYDDVRNSIEENRFLGEIHFYKYTFKYNKKGKKIEEVRVHFNGTNERLFFNYNRFGFLKKESVQKILKEGNERKKTKITYKYKYDSNGNWTQKIKFIAGIPVFIIEREIAYFKSPSY